MDSQKTHLSLLVGLLKHNTMKRVAILFLCAALSFSCSTKEKKSETADSTSNNSKCISINTEEFNKKVYDTNSRRWSYLGDKPAVVDFYADWCGPCKELAPILEEIANEKGDEVVFYKVDIDKDPDLAKAFNIRGVPTVVYIPMQGEPNIVTGFKGKEDVINNVNRIIK